MLTDLESQIFETNMTRRKFMGLSIAGVMSGLGSKAIKYLNALESEHNGFDHYFEGKKPRFRIGWHALLKKDIKPVTAVIGGELDFRSLEVFFDMDISKYENETNYTPLASVNKNLHPSTRGNRKSHEEHIAALSAAKDNGTQVLTCDNLFCESIGRNRIIDGSNLGNERFLQLLMIGMGSGTLTLGKLVYNFVKSKGLNDITYNKLEKTEYAYKKLLYKYPKLIKITKYLVPFYVGNGLANFDKDESLGDVNSIFHSIEKGLVGIQDSDLAMLHNLIDLRSLSMIFNYRLGMSLLDKMPNIKAELLTKFDPSSLETLFFAGAGHMKAKLDNSNDNSSLRDELNSSQAKIIIKFVKSITDALGDDQNLNEQIKYFVLNCACFSFPIASYMRTKEYTETKTNLEYSSRADFWTMLLEAYKQKPENEAIKIMIESIVSEDIAFFNKLDKSIPQIRQKANNKGMCQQIIDFKLRRQDYELRIVDGIPVVSKKSEFK